jgi:hypothetical protein
MKRREHDVERAIPRPLGEVVINSTSRWQVARQIIPLTIGAQEIQNRIHDLTGFDVKTIRSHLEAIWKLVFTQVRIFAIVAEKQQKGAKLWTKGLVNRIRRI